MFFEGTRVRLKETIDIYPIGVFDAGLTGTVVYLDPTGVSAVRLDTHFPALNEWDNELQIWRNGSDEGPTWELLEEVR
jgi:hypothetical protein